MYDSMWYNITVTPTLSFQLHFRSTCHVPSIFPLGGWACACAHVERYGMWNDIAVGATALLFHTDAHAHMWNNIACGTKK